MIDQVLVVDDEPSIRFVAKTILKSEELEVVTAQSGNECLNLLKQGFKGLILMDVMMPEIDGWQTVKQIKDQDLLDGNVICMLTAVNSPGENMEEVKDCIIDYITKPFEPDHLVYRVKNALALLH